MKRIVLSLTLVLALVLAVGCVSAFAASVVASPQKLIVNNQEVKCEVYNIDGYNYFKLRDMAYMLSETPGQFGVDWDSTTKTVSIATDGSYTPVGGELVIGADKSKTAVVSPQKILIDGTLIEDLSVYNIGGNNYFKLRDLGEALGFGVDYDKENNAMLVNSYGPREESDVSAFKFEEEQQYYDSLIFTDDVTITGTEGETIIFVNCEFKGDVINKATGSAMVYIDPSCVFASGSEMIISNSKKEADFINDGFPKFCVENSSVNVVCENCFGAVVSTGDSVQLNGKTYSRKDVTSIFDETLMDLVPYDSQEFEILVVGQYWTKGEQQITVIGE